VLGRGLRWIGGWSRGWRGAPPDAGGATLEYVLTILTAAALAVALYKVVTGDSVSSALAALVDRALHAV
jgi:hypothetical protein